MAATFQKVPRKTRDNDSVIVGSIAVRRNAALFSEQISLCQVLEQLDSQGDYYSNVTLDVQTHRSDYSSDARKATAWKQTDAQRIHYDCITLQLQYDPDMLSAYSSSLSLSLLLAMLFFSLTFF